MDRRLEKLGKWIKETRIRKGISLNKLANEANISKGNLSEIERGMRDPKYTTLMSISGALDEPLPNFLPPVEKIVNLMFGE